MKHRLEDTPSRHSHTGAIVLLLIGMISVQSGAAIAKHLFPLIGPRGATALRISFATLILSAVHRPWRHRLTPRERRTILIFGVVLGAMNLTYYLALSRIPLGIAVAIEFIGPLAVALLASHHLRDMVWAALAAVGLLFLVPIGHVSVSSLDPVGVAFALAAGVCWALYIIFGQRAGAAVPSGVATTWGMLTAACVALPFGVSDLQHAPFTQTILLMAIAVAVLSSALPYSLEMIALQRLPTKTFGVFMSVEPAIAAILGLVVLRERLSVTQWIAIACVITASLGSTATTRTPTVTPEVTA